MKMNSRQIIYYAIILVSKPRIIVNKDKSIEFQKAINEQGLDFSTARLLQDRIVIQRDNPTSLVISAISLQNQQYSHFSVNSTLPVTSELFIAETEAALRAFHQVWPADPRQLLRVEARVSELHETTEDHAFREIWESRLGQPNSSLQVFKKLIRGGGIKIILDPKPDEVDPIQIEIKEESYLQDIKKIFLETVFRWMKPLDDFDIRDGLTYMNEYINNKIIKFIRGDTVD